MAVVNLYHNNNSVPDTIEIYDEPFAAGGEGKTFISKDSQYVVKIYHAHPLNWDNTKRGFLEKITDIGTFLTPEQEQFLCWPLALVQSIDGIPKVGCVTRRIAFPPHIKLIDMNNSHKKAVNQFYNGKSWSHYLQIARGIARTVTFLHGMGCVHADLSNRNFFVNQENCNVVLFDLDGLVVTGFLPAFVDGTPGIIAREIMLGQAKPSEVTERHSLAVLVLQTLLFRNVFESIPTYDPDDPMNDEKIGWGPELTFSEDPSDRRNRPSTIGIPLAKGGFLSYKMLTPALQKLTERACIEGKSDPAKRPLAKEWIDALSYALDELYQCPSCHLHYPYQYWRHPLYVRSCPFCGQRISGNLPSVVRLYEPRSRGKYISTQRNLVMNNGWQLFPDVLDPQRNIPMSRKNESSIGHVERDEKINRLVNDEDTTWHARIGDSGSVITVGKGNSLPLQPGTFIQFGQGRRLLVVSE